MEYLFITGAYRSGTTLVDKLLNNHPAGFVASQPFPFLFFSLKRKFNELYGITSEPYPVNPNFPREYSHAEFENFLKKKELSGTFIGNSLKEMEGYSGCGSTEIFQIGPSLKGGSISEVYEAYCNKLLNATSTKEALFIGSKEIIAEDYIPYYLHSGVKVILVIRDPRDMVLSANFSKRSSFMGTYRPILYTLRMWRKSVSLAIDHEGDPGLLVIRYEDLVSNPYKVLERIAGFLEVETFKPSFFEQGILDQYGKTWKGNSSFSEYNFIDPSSVGRYKKDLPKLVLEYVESVCGPEMKYMAYLDSPVYKRESIVHFIEPSSNIHDHFESDYSMSANNINNELLRHDLLIGPFTEEEKHLSYFQSKKTFSKLKSLLSHEDPF